MKAKEIGIFGEKIASDYLREKGYKVLDRNYTDRFNKGPQKGEIDIIAKKGKNIHFIEVKTLSSDRLISPEKKVDYLKRKKIIKTATRWLIAKKIPLESQWQIDIIAITLNLINKKAKIRHFKNAVF